MKLSRIFSSLFLVVVSLALVLGLELAVFAPQRIDWPDFSAVSNSAGAPAGAPVAPGQAGAAPGAPTQTAPAPLSPQIVTRLSRDFGYRIGDIVPVSLFIKQQAGTEVDMHSIALEGDFEIASEPKVVSEELADGTKRIKADLKLQSFSNAPKLGLKATISYRVLSTNEDFTVTLPGLEAYTSNTWDKRKVLMTGSLTGLYGYDLWVNGALILGGFAMMVVFWGLYRKYRSFLASAYEARPKPPRFILARKAFNEVWAKMAAGDRSAENYVEIERIVRDLYNVKTKTTLEAGYWFLMAYNGPHQVVEILHQCDRVIYGQEVLSEDEHNSIKKIFDKLVPNYKPSVIEEALSKTGAAEKRRRQEAAQSANNQKEE